jgi:GT2 family glycosyltransferase
MANFKKIKLSIIILSWNTKELLRQCLDSVRQSFKASNLPAGKAGFQSFKVEIIVVDNGSTDGSADEIKKAKIKMQNENLKFKIILNKENLGFARGNNQGIRVAHGEYILLLNSDTVVQQGTLPKLMAVLNDKVEPCQVVSPMLLFPDGRPQTDYYMKFPNLWQVFLYHNPALRPVVLKIPFLRNLIYFSSQEKVFLIDQLPGAALMANRKVWEEVGFLDEDYHFLYEDVDWCYRAKKKGYRLAVVPEAKIFHLGGASWKKKLKENGLEFYRQFFSSMLLFVKKNYGEARFKVFRVGLILNFLLQLKFRLAWWFFIKKDPAMQEALWQ